MHARILKPRRGPVLLVKPLREGDVRTVMAVFERLSDESRRSRFNGPKPCLGAADLRQLALVDSTHHVLVAYAEGDPQPFAIARLVRDGRSAEIAFAVADKYQQRGIGSTITAELVMDARDGIDVSLFWSKPTNRLTLAIVDARFRAGLEFDVEGGNALDAFNHPYAYLARVDPWSAAPARQRG